jgi:hypothetical protein
MGVTAVTIREGKARSGNTGKFAKSAETALRDIEATKLRAAGHDYDEIAAELGFSNRGNAFRAVERCLAAARAEPAATVVKLELARIDAMYKRFKTIFDGQHITVSNGRVVYGDDGRPVPDFGPNIAAGAQMQRLMERRAKMLGTDAPIKSRIEVITDDVAQMLVDQLEAELASLADPADPDRGVADNADQDR